MPVPFPAFKLSCSECGWSKVVMSKSDVLTHNQLPTKCPKCGQSHLNRSKLSVLEKILARSMS